MTFVDSVIVQSLGSVPATRHQRSDSADGVDDEDRPLLSPQGMDDAQRLIELPDPYASRREIVAVSTVLLFVPARARAQDEPSTAQELQRGAHSATSAGLRNDWHSTAWPNPRG